METLSLAVGVCCILLVRVGQMLFQTGISRSKNAASAALRLVCDFAVATLIFWAAGGAILLQERNPYLGLSPGMLFGENIAVLTYLCLLLVATGQLVGAIGERSRFVIVAPLSALMALLVYPIIGNWVWIGFLRSRGVIDVGGAISLHIPAMVISLIVARAVGPRSGKYNRDGSCNAVPGHSVTLMAIGSLVLVAGWIAYLTVATMMRTNAQSWQVVFNGILASAAGAAGAMLYSTWRFGKPDLVLSFLGLLSGIAGITAGGGLLPAWAAAALGLVCGMIGPWGALWIDIRWRIDDASGLASAMGISAVVSAIGAALLVPGPLMARLVSLAANAGGIVLAVLVSGALGWALVGILKRFTKLRASEADEYDGLDLAEHDINAYPDFQQTMIKSHHLRQA